jgi:membrane-bound lytic murein transglycosylase B
MRKLRGRRIARHVLMLFVLFAAALPGIQPGMAQDETVFRGFLGALWPDAKARGIRKQTFDAALTGIALDPAVIRLTEKQSEFSKPVWDYVANALSPQRLEKGRALLQKHATTVAGIEKTYGVDGGVLLGIWGMETSFGAVTGDKDVIRSLASLAFVRYRGDFFRNELLAALEIIDQGWADRDDLRGSWAGAMGQTQFMPTTYRSYSVDFDRDGHRDIWNSVPDALASTANYLRGHGWTPGLPWGFEIIVPNTFDYRGKQASFAEWARRGARRADGAPMPNSGEARLFFPAGVNGPLLLVTTNFDAIKQYNNSESYALAVAHLGDRLKGGSGFKARWPSDEPQLTQPDRIEVQKRLAALGYDVGEADGRIGSKTREALRDFQQSRGHVPDGYPSPQMLQALRAER